MNPILKLRYKARVGALLGAMLLLLLLNTIAGQQSFTRMQKDATSIYKDRLMPSTFLFDIREQLYQERLMLSSGAAPAVMASNLSARRTAIAALIHRYEQTVLTDEEHREWTAFKTHLRNFHNASGLSPESNRQFDLALAGLANLKVIQAGEGAHLQKDLSRIGANTELRAYVEIILLIVTGAITLSLIGFSRNVFKETVTHRPSLN